MRKCYLFFGIAWIFAAGSAFAKEEFFVVKEGCVVPLYNTEDLKSLPYYVGHYGTSCRKLMSVLLPGSFLELISKNAKGVCKVSWLRREDKTNVGYVHEQFLGQCCRQVQEKDVKYEVSPMPLEEIRKFFARCPGQIPYCWGGNWEYEIELPQDYGFEQVSEDPKEQIKEEFVGMPYRLRGFDCCGVVYYVAGGLLKRTTWGIREQGKLLRCFDKKSKEISREELAKFLDTLCDTDCIILRGRSEEDIKRIPEYSAKNIGTDAGHLAVWYNGGILEFRGVDYGCEYRKKREEVLDRVMRWIKLVKDSKNDQCDLRFIRWHPELLKEEFKTYFPQEK